MKIAFDGRPFRRPPHSARRVLALLVEAARRMGWQVELWTDGPFLPEFSQYEAFAVPTAKAVNESDAAACWMPGLSIIRSHVPEVVTVHDVNPLLPDGRPAWMRLMRALRFRFRVRRIGRLAWRIATDTEHARKQVAAFFPLLEAKLRVVPLYVDESVAPPDVAERDRLLATAGLRAGFVLFVGGLRRHKNWDGLIRAYAGLPAAMKREYALVLAGPARREFDNAKALAAARGVGSDVHVLGPVDEAVLRALYGGAALFMFPSFLEGFGLPPLEAMACGVPVVATNRTSVPEVLGDAAMYVDPADEPAMTRAMARMLEDRVLRRGFVGKGLARVKEFSAERTGRAMGAALNPGPVMSQKL